jgi:hypothetical protein
LVVVKVVVVFYAGAYIGAESIAGYAVARAVGSIAGHAVGLRWRAGNRRLHWPLTAV